MLKTRLYGKSREMQLDNFLAIGARRICQSRQDFGMEILDVLLSQSDNGLRLGETQQALMTSPFCTMGLPIGWTDG